MAHKTKLVADIRAGLHRLLDLPDAALVERHEKMAGLYAGSMSGTTFSMDSAAAFQAFGAMIFGEPNA